MLSTILLSLAVLMALAILVIGGFYLFSPERMIGSFGLKLPAADADTRAWLRLKGVRDIASGLVVLALMLTTGSRSVGIALLVLAINPFWRHVGRPSVGRVEVGGVLDSRRDLSNNACCRPVVDPCPLRDVQQ
jgi:uncharacterized iron-regulated membrane protein